MNTTTVTKNTFRYPASNGEHDIHAICWLPNNDNKIKAILQISHGMAEHSGRYDDFARFMVYHGFGVYANDHAGHGYSVNKKSGHGYFGSGNGRDHAVKDMHRLTLIAKREYPGKPFFLLGHSMGSFLSRKYTIQYGNELSGVIYMGTGSGNPFLKTGIFLSKLFTKIKGAKSTGDFLDRLAFGKFNKRISNPKSRFDWLSVNEENVKSYLADPFNGFTFTNSAFHELFSLINEVSDKTWFEQLPLNLPILLIAGTEDPVGDYGKGIYRTAQLIKKAGIKDVTVKLFDGMRHEILNEKNNTAVYEFINQWLNQILLSTSNTL